VRLYVTTYLDSLFNIKTRLNFSANGEIPAPHSCGSLPGLFPEPLKVTSNDAHYQVLELIEREPELTQRQMADRLGLTLGKTHYALKAVVGAGWVRAERFAKSDSKRGYLYVLTPEGVGQRVKLAADLLERKKAEYEALRREIEVLSREVGE